MDSFWKRVVAYPEATMMIKVNLSPYNAQCDLPPFLCVACETYGVGSSSPLCLVDLKDSAGSEPLEGAVGLSC